jgi:hypothetical protein
VGGPYLKYIFRSAALAPHDIAGRNMNPVDATPPSSVRRVGFDVNWAAPEEGNMSRIDFPLAWSRNTADFFRFAFLGCYPVREICGTYPESSKRH